MLLVSASNSLLFCFFFRFILRLNMVGEQGIDIKSSLSGIVQSVAHPLGMGDVLGLNLAISIMEKGCKSGKILYRIQIELIPIIRALKHG